MCLCFSTLRNGEAPRSPFWKSHPSACHHLPVAAENPGPVRPEAKGKTLTPGLALPRHKAKARVPEAHRGPGSPKPGKATGAEAAPSSGAQRQRHRSQDSPPCCMQLPSEDHGKPGWGGLRLQLSASVRLTVFGQPTSQGWPAESSYKTMVASPSPEGFLRAGSPGGGSVPPREVKFTQPGQGRGQTHTLRVQTVFVYTLNYVLITHRRLRGWI